MKILEKTKAYLVGSVENDPNGDVWRNEVKERLAKRNIQCFDPYCKPFIHEVEENPHAIKARVYMMETGIYDIVAEQMKTIRAHDLNCVDRCDFIIANIDPKVPTWGSVEELVTAVKIKKPIFLSIVGGKKKTPLWLMGMIQHKYIYDDMNSLLSMIEMIDDGVVKIDSDRWRLLKPSLR